MSLAWALARGSGMTAFVLLSVVVALGLLLSMHVGSRRWTRGLTTETHRFLTTLALWVTGLHLTMLLADSKAGISLIDLVVPFVAPRRSRCGRARGHRALDRRVHVGQHVDAGTARPPPLGGAAPARDPGLGRSAAARAAERQR